MSKIPDLAGSANRHRLGYSGGEGRQMPRRLVTILSIDAVGYSALVAADEALTLMRFRRDRDGIIEPLVTRHAGRVFKWLGDGCFCEFPSAVEGLNCAMAVAADSARTDFDPPTLTYRFGLHVGDVVEEDGDLLGDGVNFAARLQQNAKPGEILISDATRKHVEKLVKARLEPAGEMEFKNLPGRHPVFRVAISKAASTQAAFSADPRLSIAVLPFQNMSRDPEQEDFCDGVVEEITSRLSRLKWLLVIARNSTFVYKGKGELDEARSMLSVLMTADPTLTVSAYRKRHPMFRRLADIHAHWLRVAGLPEA